MEVHGERALFLKARQKYFPPSGHLLRRGCPEHLRDGFRGSGGDAFDLRLRHGNEQQQVPLQQLGRSVDHLWPHHCFSEVGDPEDERPPRLQTVEHRGRPQMIGFAGFGPDLGEQIDHLSQVRRTAAWQQALLDVLPVSEQAHTIPGV